MHVSPSVISAAKICLPLGERKPCRKRQTGTAHYKDRLLLQKASLAKSILRIKRSNAAPHHLGLKGTDSGPSLCKGAKLGADALALG